MKSVVSYASPFVIAGISVSIADINAIGALLLTVIGVIHSAAALWKTIKNRKSDDSNETK